jgi:hypothetical protein
MTYGKPVNTPKPSTQLPQGRYPASAGVIWTVAGLAVLIGLTLAVLVPVALSSDGNGTAVIPGSLDDDGRDGGIR